MELSGMVMVSSISTTVAVAGALLLCHAGLHQLADPTPIRESLRRTGLLPVRTAGTLARALPWVETATGVLVLGAFLLAPGLPLRVALAVQSGLFLMFAGYLVLLRVVAPDAPCGCVADGSAGAVAVLGNTLIAGSGLVMLATLAESPALAGTGWSGRGGTVVLAAVLAVGYLLARAVRRSTGSQPVGGGV